jgi:predicted transcriptional regulator of viral defense system
MTGGLSELQLKVLHWLEQNKHWIVTLDEIASYLGCSEKEAHSICLGLALGKRLATLRHDQYLLLTSPTNQPLPSIHPLIIGSYLATPYYFSLQTATAYHGLSPPTTEPVYIVTTQIRPHVDIRGISYRFIRVLPRKFYGYETVRINGVDVHMADKEKAMVDCLEKTKYAGGLIEVFGLLKKNIHTLDIQKLVDYTVLMGTSALIQRLGYLLDQLDVSFDEEFLQSYSLSVPTHLDPSPTYEGRSKRDEKWNLMINVPETVFEKEM